MNIFVPFLGDFLSIRTHGKVVESRNLYFRPLSWGLSFNALLSTMDMGGKLAIFVPFLGDFLSMDYMLDMVEDRKDFRPLSWGLSFNWVHLI